MTWNPHTTPIDWITLQGQRSPGIATVSGLGTGFRWDERTGPGLSGGFLVFMGIKIQHFSTKIRLYNETDWAGWYAFLPLLAKPPPMVRPKAMQIEHPLTALHEISAVVIEEWTGPEEEDPGVFAFDIKFAGFRVPKQTYAKPDAAKATEQDPVDQYIDSLVAQKQQLQDHRRKP